jgi:CRP-like cAMP-binding protein
VLADLALEGVRDRLLLLRTNPNFAPLEDDDLLRIAEHARISHAPKGTVLCREGDPLKRIFLLTEGHVVVHFKGRTVADIRGQGGVGLLSLFAGLETTPEAVALQDSMFLELPAEIVRSNVFESFAIARNTLRLLALGLLDRRGQLPVPDARGPEVGVWRDREPTVVERVLMIRNGMILATAHLDAIAELARRSVEVRFAEGETLWHIGEPTAFSLRVEFGKVKCTNAKGESVIVGAGNVIGMMDALAGIQRSYEAVALTPLITTKIETATQLAVLEAHPQMASTLRMNLARAFLAP